MRAPAEPNYVVWQGHGDGADLGCWQADTLVAITGTEVLAGHFQSNAFARGDGPWQGERLPGRSSTEKCLVFTDG